MKLKDYIKNIHYEYIETYSLLRNEKYEDLLSEIEALEKSIKEPKFGWYRQTKRLSELKEYANQRQYILTDNHNFHPTSEKISTINRNEADAHLLDKVLCTEYDAAGNFATACVPIFRDALVFYNERNSIITALNICFECNQMYSEEAGTISAHDKNYQNLAEFLHRKGHKI